MTLKELYKRIKDRKLIKEQNAILENERTKSPSTDLRGWKKINPDFLSDDQKMFLFERHFSEDEKYFDDDPDRIVDFILAENDTLIGFVEIKMYDDQRIATLSTQEQLKDMMLDGKFPLDVKDNNYLTISNDVAILVDDAHRNQKLGEKMFNTVFEYLKRARYMNLRALQVMPKALSFYTKNGGRVLEGFETNTPTIDFNVNEKIRDMRAQEQKSFKSKDLDVEPYDG